jgi:hypothetical protein
MVEASFGGIFRVLLYILLFSFLIRLVARMAMPYVLRKGEEAMREQARRHHETFNAQHRKEGEVTIEKENKGKGRSGNDEYVDFVEVKD